MPVRRKRKFFQNSEPAYRAFLNKFEKNKKFNDACIIPALEHAYNETFKCKLRPDIRTRLVQVVYECKDKVLRDLETLKNSPDSEIGPLKHENSMSNNEIDKMTKKRKLNDADISKKETTVSTEAKRRGHKRSSTKNKSLQSNKKNQHSEITSKILKVTIENDKSLQDMARSCANSSKDNENQSSEINTKENDSNHHLKESNQEENESLEVIQNHNESVESISRSDENDKSYTIEAVSIKTEIDLSDDFFQTGIPIPLPEEELCPPAEVTSNNAFSLETNAQSNVSNIPIVSVNSQENLSSLNIACYNNFIPPVQSFNNFNQTPQINCCPCIFMHNHMMMNSHYGCYHGMYNFPMMNPFLPHSHHAASFQHGLQQQQANKMTDNRSLNQLLHLQNFMPPVLGNQLTKNSPPSSLNASQPFQQQLTNQIMGRNPSPQVANTAQELSKLQTAISNLNSQLTSLQNAWNQSKSK